VVVCVDDDGGLVVVCDDDGGWVTAEEVGDGGWLVSDGWLWVGLCELALSGADVLVGPVLTPGVGVLTAPPDVCRNAIMMAAAIASNTKAVPTINTGGR